MGEIFFLVRPHTTSGGVIVPGMGQVIVEIPWLKDKNLHRYLHDLHLNNLRTKCRTTLDPNNLPLRVSYIPKPGDVVRMEPTRSFS